MKRLLSLLLLAALLLPWLALASSGIDLSALSDQELQALIDSATRELKSRHPDSAVYLAEGRVAGIFIGIKSLSRAEDMEGRPAFTLTYDLRNETYTPLIPILVFTLVATQRDEPSEMASVFREEGLSTRQFMELQPGEMILDEREDYLLQGDAAVTLTFSQMLPGETASPPFVVTLPLDCTSNRMEPYE